MEAKTSAREIDPFSLAECDRLLEHNRKLLTLVSRMSKRRILDEIDALLERRYALTGNGVASGGVDPQ